MTRYIAFLRAINVGGHARIPMHDLRDAFGAAGCLSVRTYIQSGNVIFESSSRNPEALLRKVRGKLRGVLGSEPEIMLRSFEEMQNLVRGAPFKSSEAEKGIKLYVVFLLRMPRSRPLFPLASSKEALKAIDMSRREVFVVSRRKANGFFGFPNEFVEKVLGVPAASRNWSTVLKMVQLAQWEL